MMAATDLGGVAARTEPVCACAHSVRLSLGPSASETVSVCRLPSGVLRGTSSRRRTAADEPSRPLAVCSADRDTSQ